MDPAMPPGPLDTTTTTINNNVKWCAETRLRQRRRRHLDCAQIVSFAPTHQTLTYRDFGSIAIKKDKHPK
jgi:hypothetical protein